MQVIYLGFRLTPNRIKPDKDKFTAVEIAKISKTKMKVKSFAGLCNFFKTHIKDYARICEHLIKVTKKMQVTPKAPSLAKVGGYSSANDNVVL